MLKILYAGSPAPAATTLRLLLEKCSQDQNATNENGSQDQKSAANGDCSQDQNGGASQNGSQDQKGGGWKIAGVLTNPPSAKVWTVTPVWPSQFRIAAGTGVAPRYLGKSDG